MTDNTHAETPDQLLERLTLAAIERRAAAADGPWTLHGPDPEWTVYDATGRLVAVVATAEEAMLIADAPTDVSRLLAEVRRLRADLEHARAVVAEADDE